MIVDEDGSIFRTIDGGTTWFEQSSASENENQCIALVGLNTAYVAGENGTILKNETAS